MRFSIFGQPQRFQKVLREKPIRYLAAGFVLGMFIGLLPLGFNSIILLILFFSLRHDFFTAILSAVIFSLLGFAIDPLAHTLGLAVLQAGFLQRLWIHIYNLPFLPFTGFNNTLVMGNVLIGIILTIPSIFSVKIFVNKYRSKNSADIKTETP